MVANSLPATQPECGYGGVSSGQTLAIYDVGTEGTNLNYFALSPDGRYLAYGSSDGSLTLARMPLELALHSSSEKLGLDWEGGSGLYQVQGTTNLLRSPWVNLVGPTTNTSTNMPLPGTSSFFRIQSLPSAP